MPADVAKQTRPLKGRWDRLEEHEVVRVLSFLRIRFCGTSYVQHEPRAMSARAADHHDPAMLSFLRPEYEVAMIGRAFQYEGFARSACADPAGGLGVDVGPPQGVEDRGARRDVHGHAGLGAFDFECGVGCRVCRFRSEPLDVQGAVRPFGTSLLDRGE
jgi:hypothetical protein